MALHTLHVSLYNIHGLGGEFKDQHIYLQMCTEVFLQYSYKPLTCTRDQGKMGTNYKPVGIIVVYSPCVQMGKTGVLWLPMRI